MTTLPFTLKIDPLPGSFLFTVRGTLVPTTLEAARRVHNEVAGSDQAVAAARSFGDLSHAVFFPVEPAKKGAPLEMLILDYWNSPEGLGRFFADPEVRRGGATLYSQSDTVLWQTTPGLPRVGLPAPTGRTERYVGIVRGLVASRAKAEAALSAFALKTANQSRARGLLSREYGFRLPAPGEKPSLELIGLDVWFDAEGMEKDYAEPAMDDHLGTLFTGEMDVSVWQKPKGQWVEW